MKSQFGLKRYVILIAVGLFFVSLLLYISALAPSVVTIFDDSLEFQLVTYQLGIAHPTGYPLYTLLGKLFTLIPVGNVAYRVNFMSAVFGAGTVALLYLIIFQLAVTQNRGEQIAVHPPQNLSQAQDHFSPWPVHLGATIGALLLAVGLVFWQQATIAEVYTLNAFFVAALLLLAIHLSSLEEGQRGILWLAFLTGLSLTYHRTMLLFLPALVLYLYLIYGTRLFKPKTVLLSSILGLLPLLLYLYLPWRGHIGSLDGTYQNTWVGFWQQVSASGYGLFIFDNPFGQDRNLIFYWNLLADQFYITIPGFIGLVYLLRFGQPKMLALTGLTFLTYLFFNLFYNVTDIEVFFIPIFLLWAIWSGVGATFLIHTAATVRHTLWRPVIVSVLLAIFAFIILQLFQTNGVKVKQSYSWQVHDYGLDVLQQPLPSTPGKDSAIVGILGEMTLLRYFQQTENQRPDIETVVADSETERLVAIENLLAAGKSVYLTRPLPGAPDRWSLNAVGPLIRVDPAPITMAPEVAFALNKSVTPQITLLGYDLSRLPHTGQGPAPLRLTLFWQVNETVVNELKVSARLVAPTDQVQAVADAVPVHFAYPTTRWRPNEIISDVYDLELPADTPPGLYTPLIIWYNPAQNAAEAGRIELEPVVIE